MGIDRMTIVPLYSIFIVLFGFYYVFSKCPRCSKFLYLSAGIKKCFHCNLDLNAKKIRCGILETTFGIVFGAIMTVGARCIVPLLSAIPHF